MKLFAPIAIALIAAVPASAAQVNGTYKLNWSGSPQCLEGKIRINATTAADGSVASYSSWDTVCRGVPKMFMMRLSSSAQRGERIKVCVVFDPDRRGFPNVRMCRSTVWVSRETAVIR